MKHDCQHKDSKKSRIRVQRIAARKAKLAFAYMATA